MKLTTNQIIDLFNALSALRGEPTISINERGQKETVYVPYPLSDKVKWNAAKNRGILKRLVVAHDELMMDAKAEINAFKKDQIRAARTEQDPKVLAEKMQAAQDAIQDKVDVANEQARVIGRQEQEVDSILLLPANGFCLKTSNIPPTILGELMPLIDGEPEFAPAK